MDAPAPTRTARDGELGSVDGKKVVAEMDLPDGHKFKMLEDGQCAVCSTCKRIREKYQNELRRNPDLADQLDQIEIRINERKRQLKEKYNQDVPIGENSALMREQRRIQQQLKRLAEETKVTPRIKNQYSTELGDPRNSALKQRLDQLEGRNPYSSSYQRKVRALERDLRTARAARKLDRGGGHGFADHGAHVTQAQHLQRLQTGMTPSGQVRPTNASSNFVSNKAQIEAATRARAKLNSELTTSGTPPQYKDVIIDANGAGTTYTLSSTGTGLTPGVSTTQVKAWFHRRGSPGNYYYVMTTIYPF